MSRLSRTLNFLGISVVAVFVAVTVWDYLPGAFIEPASALGRRDHSAPAGKGPRVERVAQIHALARLEPAGGLVIVGARPGARIERILVKAGDSVNAGQPLVVLEGQPEAQRQLALAEARKADAIHQRAQRRDQLAVERTREDRVRKARDTVLDDTEKAIKSEDARLLKSINDLGGATQAGHLIDDLNLKLDQVRIESYKAYFEREQAHADKEVLERKRALEDQTLADGGPGDKVLDRQVDLARAALDAATVSAPTRGQVIDVLAHAGEVSSGPLLALGELDEMAAVAEVDQEDASKLGVGDSAEVTILGTTVPGKITMIGRVVGRNQLFNVDPRALQDRRVLKVTIQLSSGGLAARFINMQVDATISPGGTRVR